MSAVSPPADALVSVDNLHTHYGKSHILHGVTLHVGAGEVVGLLGRNGVGKSTTLKTIMGLARASAGEVLLAGRSIAGWRRTGWRRSGSATSPKTGASSAT